jgi:hypothetical protein
VIDPYRSPAPPPAQPAPRERRCAGRSARFLPFVLIAQIACAAMTTHFLGDRAEYPAMTLGALVFLVGVWIVIGSSRRL